MLIPGKTKCISNVGLYYFPHFIIIQAFALHHTYIDFCKYCDIQKGCHEISPKATIGYNL